MKLRVYHWNKVLKAQVLECLASVTVYVTLIYCCTEVRGSSRRRHSHGTAALPPLA